MSKNTITKLFASLNNPNAAVKIAAKASQVIKDRLRAESAVERIIPSVMVSPDECDRSTMHDNLTKMVDIEPESRAMTMTTRGEPRANFIRGRRVRVPFYTVMSDMFSKTEQELLSYGYDVAKLLKENCVKDLSDVEDRQFITFAESAVQGRQAEANGGAVTTLNRANAATAPRNAGVIKGELATAAAANTAVSLPPQRGDVVDLLNVIEGRRLRCECILMVQTDYNNLMKLTLADNGDQVQSDIFRNGMTGDVFLGRKIVTTVKSDVFRPGNVYAFTSPEFLGVSYVLQNVKFWIDKVVNRINFVAWKDVAQALVNDASVAKLELYSGDATTNDADSILAEVSPVPESELGRRNNSVDARTGTGYHPGIVTF